MKRKDYLSPMYSSDNPENAMYSYVHRQVLKLWGLKISENFTKFVDIAPKPYLKIIEQISSKQLLEVDMRKYRRHRRLSRLFRYKRNKIRGPT